MLESSSWYLSQFALAYCLRGFIGIMIGYADMVAMMGRWSDEVGGPCSRWMLWYALLLERTMSGVLDVLLSIRVGNEGPRYLTMFWSMSEVILVPIGFVEE